jgi:hypothetical protein
MVAIPVEIVQYAFRQQYIIIAGTLSTRGSSAGRAEIALDAVQLVPGPYAVGDLHGERGYGAAVIVKPPFH